jgi:hypothetical protein
MRRIDLAWRDRRVDAALPPTEVPAMMAALKPLSDLKMLPGMKRSRPVTAGAAPFKRLESIRSPAFRAFRPSIR